MLVAETPVAAGTVTWVGVVDGLPASGVKAVDSLLAFEMEVVDYQPGSLVMLVYSLLASGMSWVVGDLPASEVEEADDLPASGVKVMDNLFSFEMEVVDGQPASLVMVYSLLASGML